MSKRTIEVEGVKINLYDTVDNSTFISLTDIAKQQDDEPRFIIRNWLSTQNTISYLGKWEDLHNPSFNRAGFRTVKDQFFENTFSLTPSKWIETTQAIGLTNKSGRYGGGTYAHQDIAINFCYWLSPTFQIYLIKEFQRLKELEQKEFLLNHEWDISRLMTKANFHILTDTIREKLMPPDVKDIVRGSSAFSAEVDLINLALFGMTADQWRKKNPDLEGNIRDHATIEQLIVLSNLQSLDAKLLEWDCDDTQRLHILNAAARKEMEILMRVQDKDSLGKLKDMDWRDKRLK